VKRRYRTVAVSGDRGRFRVVLDDRALRTPGRRELALPTRALAEAVAEEWRAQESDVVPASMPLTRLANTAVDRIAGRRDEVVAQVVAYAETDLLCYRAGHPAELAARQRRSWQPVLDWLARRFEARLCVTEGVVPVTQEAGALRALVRAVEGYDAFRLAAVSAATHASGSIALALALIEGEIDAAAAVAASQLDEHYQVELWGDDAEAEARRRAIAAEVGAAAAFAALLEAPG
jgi:chaperone required for assembly of F1-ATPase